MKRSRNAIFKYTIVLGAAMSLSACNGIFENIYDAPIESRKIAFHKSRLLNIQNGPTLTFRNVRLLPLKSERNMRVKFLTSGISLFIVMI